MELDDYLRRMIEQEGSDIYLTHDAKPSMKVHGKLVALDDHVFRENEVKTIAYALLQAEQIRDFEKNMELNLALARDGIGRFRVNLFWQRGQVGMVIRHIKTEIPQNDALGLPPILQKVIMEKRGLVLFVGATGSGKSTSLASLIDYRNTHSAGHIVTVEDPIEFIHPNKASIVNQREVGLDTISYMEALKNTLRQAPDVILIGEVRSAETMEHAIAFAETGHLCVSTLHANNANQALDRIINFFPEERHKQLLLDLSLNIRAIVSQRLIPAIDGRRALAVEVLLGTPLICEMIKRGDIIGLKELMQKSETLGMQTFDSALYQLYKDQKISYEEALRNADSENNLRLRISLEKGLSDDPVEKFSLTENEDEKKERGTRGRF